MQLVVYFRSNIIRPMWEYLKKNSYMLHLQRLPFVQSDL